MRRRAFTLSNPAAQESSSKLVPLSIYSHVSTYRSYQLELQLYSPSLRVDARGPLAVFNDHNQVGGRVVLDPEAYHTGTVTISIEGAFLYPSQSTSSCFSEPRKHVFFNTSTSVTVSQYQESGSPRSSFRDAFMRRRPSQSVLSFRAGMSERSYPFQFSLPQGCRPGEELPPSHTSRSYDDEGLILPACEVVYKVVASWNPEDQLEPPSHLEVPIVLQPDPDFQSKDAATSSGLEDSWLEMPLKSERPIPVRCAVTLPTSVTFCRSSSIPYFVIFTTTPRSPTLAKEVAADASISVSLIRQITIHDPQPTFPLTPPPSPSTPSSVERESPRPKLLRRVARSAARLNRKRPLSLSMDFCDKPLPELPAQKSFSQSHTIDNNICIGFPKRPRQQCDFNGRHPSLETHSSLPDGLHKERISLDKDMLPCIDWAGVSVKYYLDVSVLVGQDDLRARVPIRIF